MKHKPLELPEGVIGTDAEPIELLVGDLFSHTGDDNSGDPGGIPFDEENSKMDMDPATLEYFRKKTEENIWTARTKEIHNPHVDDVDIESLLDEPEEPIAKTKVPYPEDKDNK